MVERFGVLGSQVMILAAIYAVGQCYARLFLLRRYPIDTIQAYAVAHPFHAMLLGMPAICIITPAMEEILLHAPLIAIFPRMTTGAWVALIASSIGFGVLHGFDQFVTLIAKNNSEVPLNSRQQRGHHIWRGAITTILAMIIGYFGITRQSLFLCFGIHAAWNFTMMIGIPLILIILVSVFSIIVVNIPDLLRRRRLRARIRRAGFPDGAPLPATLKRLMRHI